MFCPCCKAEYKKGDVELLLSVTDTVEADLIINTLKNNNIECFKKDKGTGSYMNLYMGYSIYGQEIYVNQEDYEQAKQICEEIFLKHCSEEEAVEEEQQKVPAYRNIKIVSRIILGLAVGMVVLTWAVNLLVS